MTYETICFEQRDGIARITLNRPQRLNAFTIRMHEELRDALDVASASAETRVVLLTGAGRGFCAGQDLGDRKRETDGPPPDLGESIELYYKPLIQKLVSLPLPVVCAVNGVAAGAGANIALACDLVIARESARFIQAFVNIGLVADAGGTWMLPRLVGQSRALGLTLLGESLDANTAASWGLIWRSVPDESFGAEVDALLNRMAQAPTRAVSAAKRAIRNSWTVGLDDQLTLEGNLQRTLGQSSDYAEGVAAFVEKRKPVFTGR